MARDIYEMSFDLSNWQELHDAFRKVFLLMPRVISGVIAGDSKISRGQRSSISRAVISHKGEDETFTLRLLSRIYEFRFTTKVVVTQRYNLVGNLELRKRITNDTDGPESIYFDDFDFDTQGQTIDPSAQSRDLTDEFGMELFLVELLHKDFIESGQVKEKDAKAAS